MADLESDDEGVKQDVGVFVAVVGIVRWAFGVFLNVSFYCLMNVSDSRTMVRPMITYAKTEQRAPAASDKNVQMLFLVSQFVRNRVSTTEGSFYVRLDSH